MKPKRPRIEWEKVRARLQASQLALESALTVSPERLEAVYRQRAVAFASRQDTVDAPVGQRVLVFELGAEQYGLDFGSLVGVLPFTACTPVPGGPQELLGVMNIDGEIRSVIDLGRVLGLPATTGDGGYVLVLRNRGSGACVRVDLIDRVRLVPPGELVAPHEGAEFPLLDGVTVDRVKLLKTGALLDHLVRSDGNGRAGGHTEIGG